MPTPTWIENTIRAILLEELRKKGVEGAGPVSYNIPQVGRLEPDAILEDGGQYLVETKLGDETKLAEALADLHDYTKYIDSNGAFAIVYPKSLKKIPLIVSRVREQILSPQARYVATAIFNDNRPTDHCAGDFEALTSWVATHVLRPPEIVRVDVDFLIGMLQSNVGSLSTLMTHLKVSDLERMFGGRSVFENILQYEQNKYPIIHMRRAAAYLLENQILFYHILSTRSKTEFDPIDETKIRLPTDLNGYFRKAADRYPAIFGFDIPSKLKVKATPTIKRIIKSVKALKFEKISLDLVGKVFHNLIPFDTRKTVAAFYTNVNAAEMLAKLSIFDPNVAVMDPACGSRTLLVAAYRRKRELSEATGKFDENKHKQFLEQDITGIDIMPFAAHLAVIHLTLQAFEYVTKKLRVAIWDSTELQPEQKIPPLRKELRELYKSVTLDTFKDKERSPTQEELFVEKGTLTDEDLTIGKVDVIMMNPPFTRQERLDEYKQALDRRFADFRDYMHGQIGLYGYFIFLADRFLKESGRLALVLPATILRVQSAEGIRELLADNYEIEYVITTWQKLAFSEGDWFREVLLLARKKSEQRAMKECAVIRLKNSPSNLDEASECAQHIAQARNSREEENKWVHAKFISQDELAAKVSNWFDYISLYDERIIEIWNNVVKRITQN